LPTKYSPFGDISVKSGTLPLFNFKFVNLRRKALGQPPVRLGTIPFYYTDAPLKKIDTKTERYLHSNQTPKNVDNFPSPTLNKKILTTSFPREANNVLRGILDRSSDR